MATGTVKWFNDTKGFGFVTQDGGGEDIFLHHTAIQSEGFSTLEEGQKVVFDVSKGPKGLQASNVHIVGAAEPQSTAEVPIHGIVQPEPQVWRDYWTTTDALGRDVYVDALASFIRHPHTRPPLAIGLTAPWGTGKTSTMRMLQEVLDPTDKLGDRKRIEPPAWASATNGAIGAPRATMRHLLRLLRSATPYGPHHTEAPQSAPEGWHATVWFNPWVYETSEQVLAGLAHEVTTQLTGRMSPRARELFWLRLNLSRLDGQVVRQKIYLVLLQRLIPLLLLVAGLTVVVLSLLLTGFISVAGVVVSAGGLGLLADATRRAYAFMNEQVSRSFSSLVREPDYVAQFSRTDLPSAQAASLLPDPGYSSKLGFAYIVHTDMAAVMRLVATPDHPLILFIDDLDRCSTKSVTQVIEAINMFLAGEFPDCIFVLAVDPSVVAAQVGSSYKELVTELQKSRSAGSSDLIGWRFLEKIIQLPVRLPEGTLSQRSQFVASLRTNDIAKSGSATPVSESPVAPGETKIAAKPAPDDEIRLLLISAMQRRHPTADTLRQVAREAQMEVLGLSEDADLDPRVLRAAQAVLVQATGNEDAQFHLLLEAGIKRLRSGGNPRQIKRLGNVFRLYAVIAAQRSLRSLPAPSLEEAAKVASLVVQWPHLLDRLFQTVGKKEQTLLQSLEEATALTRQGVEWSEALKRVELNDDDYSGLPLEDLYDFLISDEVRIASAAQGII